MPLRQLAAVWSSFQLALAGARSHFGRARARVEHAGCRPASQPASGPVLEFENVHFSYPGGQEVLRGGTFALERGKTYALVGPTGGGKTTTASLMARLYDPTGGRVLLDGQDIRSYQPDGRTGRSASSCRIRSCSPAPIRDNILYGNERLPGLRQRAASSSLLTARNLDGLLARFEQGLETRVTLGGRRHQPRPEAAHRVHARGAAGIRRS